MSGGKPTWQLFIVAWYITQTSLALASIAACLSWLARVPFIRRAAERYATSRLRARKKIYPIRFFAGLYAGGIALFFASILPTMILHIDGIAEVFSMLDVIIVKFETFQTTGDLRLAIELAQLAKVARELSILAMSFGVILTHIPSEDKAMYVGATVTKWAAGVFCFWSFTWALCIAGSAYSLRRSIQVCIASFPCTPDVLAAGCVPTNKFYNRSIC